MEERTVYEELEELARRGLRLLEALSRCTCRACRHMYDELADYIDTVNGVLRGVYRVRDHAQLLMAVREEVEEAEALLEACGG